MSISSQTDRLLPHAGVISPKILIPTGVDGLYGHGVLLERLASLISGWVMRAGRHEQAETLRFPPLIARRHFESSKYFRNFPELVGTIHCFCGDTDMYRTLVRAHDSGRDWTGGQVASDLVMVPAACYPVYPAIAARGPVSPDGAIIDASSYCFRREPSSDLARMQMFRMHERIYIGTSEGAQTFRTRWFGHAQRLMDWLDLPGRIELANDPFFGSVGQLMASSQRDRELKFEMLVPVTSDENPTACVSFNLHLTKMAQAFGLFIGDCEELAYTSCVGFGLERLALAIFRRHGTDEEDWPRQLRSALPDANAIISA